MKKYLKPLLFCRYWALKRKELRATEMCRRSLWPVEASSSLERMTPKHSRPLGRKDGASRPTSNSEAGKVTCGLDKDWSSLSDRPQETGRILTVQMGRWWDRWKRHERPWVKRSSMKKLGGVWGWGGEPRWTVEAWTLSQATNFPFTPVGSEGSKVIGSPWRLLRREAAWSDFTKIHLMVINSI